MKLRVLKRPCRIGLCALCLVTACFRASAQQGSPTPAASPSAAKPASGKPANPNKVLSKEIPIPLPIGERAKDIKIPQNGITGKLLSELMAAQIRRIDEDHLEMQTMNIDLYQPDGKTDFHIIVPTSIFDLKTRIIHSNDPVTIRTQDFELTGEKMEFDTVERSGRLIGKVHMLVHNLKKVAGEPDETKNP